MTSEKIEQLQLLQQNMQHILQQKQQLESQETEFESALTELKTTEKAYKIVGKVMFASSKEDLTKDLTEQKEVSDVRLKSILAQEEKLKESMESIQQEVVKELQEGKNEQ